MQLTKQQRTQAIQVIKDYMNGNQIWVGIDQYNAVNNYSDRIGQAWEQWPAHETRIHWMDSKKRDEYPTDSFVDEYLNNEDDEDLAVVIDTFNA